ncbi:FtsK/SpoIIIE domain-containing protein [Rathayibacter sp. CAU 1779]
MPSLDPAVGEPLTLPRHPAPPLRSPFPLLAVLAPLIGAAVLFAVTRSTLMIAFAGLSPVIAVASTIDGRIGARRRRRADARGYADSAARFLDDVAAAHDVERRALNARHPTTSALTTDAAYGARRWAEGGDRFAPVRAGTGSVTAATPVTGSVDDESDRALMAKARTVTDAPIVADPGAGIGVVAPLPVARAYVRGLVMQLAFAHPPGVLAFSAPSGEQYAWLKHYPHVAHLGGESLVLRIVDTAEDAGGTADAAWERPPHAGPLRAAASSPMTGTVAVAEHVDDLPAGCRLVLRADASGALTVLSPTEGIAAFHGELLTAQAGADFGRALAAAARSKGVAPQRTLPPVVRWSELHSLLPAVADSAAVAPATARTTDAVPPAAAPDTSGTAADSSLSAAIGMSAAGPLVLDLVSSGPHAIVTGTTGSGKSRLLVAWVLAMAASASPSRVSFLLVDFKGGTAFRALRALPHTVGVVTDLGHGEARRALRSLRAELRRRESVLAELGVADVRDAGDGLARLVIVVDEAAAMLAAFPELSDLFADVAARGRALGVHLVLGTQRATGVLSDALVANCALRLSLRLSSEADSVALLGTDAAAHLPHSVPGRFVVARDGEVILAQAASSDPADVDAVARLQDGSRRPPAPWLPALPTEIPLAAFGAPPEGAVVLGALDDPDRQRQEGIVYRPSLAHLLVLGVRGSGRSTTLRAVAAQWAGDTIVVPADAEGAWDAVEAAEARLRQASSGTSPCLVIIDDVDALLARFDDDHRDAVADSLRALLVDGPRAGIAVVCSGSVLPSALRGVASHFGERLLLRQADRQEHTLAGAPTEFFDPEAPPGRGVWHDRAAQVVLVAPHAEGSNGSPGEIGSHPARPTSGSAPAPAGAPASSAVPARTVPLAFGSGTVTLVVTAAPAEAARRVRAADTEVEVIALDELDPRRSLGATTSLADGVVRKGARPVTGLAADLFGGPDEGPANAANPGSLRVSNGNPPTVIVGDPDAWQAQWSLLGRLRPRASIVFDGCSLAQIRSTLHSRVLPPVTAAGRLLVCDSSGTFARAAWPDPRDET